MLFWRLLFCACLAWLGFIAGASYCQNDYPFCYNLSNALRQIQVQQEKLADQLTAGADNDMQVNIDAAVTRTTDAQHYTLFTLREAREAILIDADGKQVHRWKSIPFKKAFPNPVALTPPKDENMISWGDTHVFPNGDLLVGLLARDQTPYGGGLVKMDKNSNLIWSYDANAHHVMDVDGNTGEIWVLTQDFIKTPMKDLETLTYPVLADYAVKLSADGKELVKINLFDAFKNSDFKEALFQHNESEVWDALHTNSIMKLDANMAGAFPMFKEGQLLLSLRNIDTVAVLDPETQKIVWAYAGVWRSQHSAEFLPNGHIMVYDNRGYSNDRRAYSRLIEFDPKTLGVTWSYGRGPGQHFFSYRNGQSQALANGNVFFTLPYHGTLREVDREGNIVWQYALKDQFYKETGNVRRWNEEVDSEMTRRSNYLATFIRSARRYEVDELPFLQQEVK